MKAKIRDAQPRKVPYTLVVGNREEQAGGTSVRLRASEDLGMLELSDLRDRLAQAVDTKGPP
jgi:threonyl-tRNA synthetase